MSEENQNARIDSDLIALPNKAPAVLQTKRVRLFPPLLARDAHCVHKHVTDAITKLWIGWDTPQTLDDSYAVMEDALLRRAAGHYQGWMGYVKGSSGIDTMRFCGVVSLERLSQPMRGAWYELDFWLAQEHWGQGYALEMAQAVIDWAVCFTSLPCITLSWTHGNERSRSVIERLIPGQKPEVHIAEKDGAELPVYHYVLDLLPARRDHQMSWEQTTKAVATA